MCVCVGVNEYRKCRHRESRRGCQAKHRSSTRAVYIHSLLLIHLSSSHFPITVKTSKTTTETKTTWCVSVQQCKEIRRHFSGVGPFLLFTIWVLSIEFSLFTKLPEESSKEYPQPSKWPSPSCSQQSLYLFKATQFAGTPFITFQTMSMGICYLKNFYSRFNFIYRYFAYMYVLHKQGPVPLESRRGCSIL